MKIFYIAMAKPRVRAQNRDYCGVDIYGLEAYASKGSV